MGQFDELWAYCKETFDLVKRRPFVFLPHLVFFGFIIVSFLIFIGSGAVKFFLGGSLPVISAGAFFTAVVFMVGMLLITAGQQNLYRKAALGYEINFDDFINGIKWYTGRILLGMFLTFLIVMGVSVVFMVFLVIPGINILAGIAVMVIVFLINVFLSTWKAAMAFKELGVIDAFKESYYFVKEFFWPMALITFIKGLFEGGGDKSQQGNTSGFRFNVNLPGVNPELLRRGLPLAFAGLVPIIIILAVISTLIVVYLEQLVFVIYARREGIF